MSYVTDNPDYAADYSTESDVDDASIERVGDITGEPPTNEAIDRNTASKMANLLEGLIFPATKEEIKNHVNSKSAASSENIKNILQAIQNNLQYGINTIAHII